MKDKGIIVSSEDGIDVFPTADYARVKCDYLEICILPDDTGQEPEVIAVYAPGRYVSYRFIGFEEDEIEEDD